MSQSPALLLDLNQPLAGRPLHGFRRTRANSAQLCPSFLRQQVEAILDIAHHFQAALSQGYSSADGRLRLSCHGSHLCSRSLVA